MLVLAQPSGDLYLSLSNHLILRSDKVYYTVDPLALRGEKLNTKILSNVLVCLIKPNMACYSFHSLTSFAV